VINSRRIRWLEYGACIWWGNMKKRNHLEDTRIGGRIILKLIKNNRMVGHGLDSSGSG